MPKEFMDGFIKYDVLVLDTPELQKEHLDNIGLSDWADGYLAFSNTEKRLSDLKTHNLPDLFSKGLSGVEGYLMEVDLWKNKNGIYEEVSIEREDDYLLLQMWTLDATSQMKNCYYRKVETIPRGSTLQPTRSLQPTFKDKDLNSLEVVFPEKRLHFFISAGG